MDETIEIDSHTMYDNEFNKTVAEFINYRDNGQLMEAAITCEKLVKIAPNMASLWFDYGLVLKKLGFADKAAGCFRNSAANNPDMFLSLLFLGHILLNKCNWHQTWKKAGLQQPPWSTKDFCDSPGLFTSTSSSTFVAELYNLGLDLGYAGYIHESAACHQVVTKHCPDLIHAHYGLASMLLTLGRYREAVPVLREWTERSRKNINAPFWYGEDISEKTLYIYADHGLGDVVQFIRYVRTAATRCRRTILYLPPSLWRFVGKIPNVEIVSEIRQPFDTMCSMFMLPHAVGIDEAALPGMVPYLHAEPALIAHWKQRLPKEGLRIGIAWQGNPSSVLDQGRSMPLACYAPLARLPGVTLVSLQLNFGIDQLAALPEGMTVVTLGSDFNAGPDNVVDTAAVMKNLDLIISTDTSVPHIAGALGCPVWVLLKATPDWRWQQDRNDCPWYPTMRLFRQKSPGEWDEVITRVVEAVIEHMNADCPDQAT